MISNMVRTENKIGAIGFEWSGFLSSYEHRNKNLGAI